MTWVAVVVDLQSTNKWSGIQGLCWTGLAGVCLVLGTLLGVVLYDFLVWVLYTKPWRHWGACFKRCSCVCLCKCRKRADKPILIEDSPPPSRTLSSPFRRTPSSQAGTPALRAGKRRLRSHRRHHTVAYDPSGRGDCGYQCLLKMACERPTRAKIKLLRSKTAEYIKEAAIRGEDVGSVNLPRAMKEKMQTPEDYARDVRRKQWASAAELTMASKVLNITTTLYSKYGVETINEDPKARKTGCVIYMRNQHYLLKHKHARSPSSAGKQEPVPRTTARAGMRSSSEQSQQPMLIYINPTTVHEAPRVNIFTELTTQHDVRGATIVTSRPVYMRRIRQLVGTMLSRRPDTLRLHDLEHSELPDWIPVPNIILVSGGEEDTVLADRITTHLSSGLEFELTFDVSHNHLQFLQQVSQVINLPTVQFVLTHRTGESWIFPYDIPTSSHAYLQIVRGGMRRASRSRSISPTQPYRAWGSGSVSSRLMPEPDLELKGKQHHYIPAAVVKRQHPCH